MSNQDVSLSTTAQDLTFPIQEQQGLTVHSMNNFSNNGNSSAATDVVALPELILLIGQCLDKSSLAICVRVSKAWNRLLLPCLWYSVCLHFGLGCEKIPPQINRPDMDQFQVRSALVRQLCITGRCFEYPRQTQVFCPNLRDLEIRQFNSEETNAVTPLVEFIELHKSAPIKSLWICWSDVGHELLDVISQHYHQLEELNIGQLSDSPVSWIERFESLWSRVRVLTLHGDWFSRCQRVVPYDYTEILTRLETVGLTKIEDLTLGSDITFHDPIVQIQLFLVLRSPRLVRLTWTFDHLEQSQEGPVTLMAKAIRQGRFSVQQQQQRDHQEQGHPLESLALCNGQFRDQDLCVVLKFMTHLRCLNLFNTNFGPGSWRILQQEIPRYLTTLQCLNISRSERSTGAMVHDVLCSVYNLKEFSGNYIKDTNLEEDIRSWVCLGLRVLNLAMVRTREGTEPLFYAQLSRLEELEKLNLGLGIVQEIEEATWNNVFYYNRDDLDLYVAMNNPFRLSMRHGLDQLRSLKRLYYLEGPDTDDVLSHVERLDADKTLWKENEEVRWVLEHLKKLKLVKNIEFDEQGWNKWKGHELKIVGAPNTLSRAVRGQILYSLVFPNLTSLTIFQNNKRGLIMTNFIRRHQSNLKYLEFNSNKAGVALETALECTQLLELKAGHLEWDSVDQWRQLILGPFWSQLKSLSLLWLRYRGSYYAHTETCVAILDLMKETGPASFQSLHFCNSIFLPCIVAVFLMVIRKSPKLRSLSWVMNGSNDSLTIPSAITLLSDMIKCGWRCPPLESLNFSGLLFNNCDLETLLKTTVQTLQELSLPGTEFDSGSWKILKSYLPQYLSQLTKLNLSLCNEVTGRMVQDILCSMTGLEDFAADYLAVFDIFRDPRPWVCLGLRRLQLAFFQYNEGSGIQMISRLAVLEQLEELRMDQNEVFTRRYSDLSWFFTEFDTIPFAWTLEHDLDRLKPLRRLKGLWAPKAVHTLWTEVEAGWVMEHWPRLRWIKGVTLNNEAKRILSKAGILMSHCLAL
ncbi:hypothetical protein BGZ83_005906 [Gryganskiella cystojenkinii]|nr:hypothetical protein BGZ83_005906 [Gryganskiella cystojenkinii]